MSSTGTGPAESFQSSLHGHLAEQRALALIESNREKLLPRLQEQHAWARERPDEALQSEFNEMEADEAELNKQMDYRPSERVLRDIVAQINSNKSNIDIRNGCST